MDPAVPFGLTKIHSTDVKRKVVSATSYEFKYTWTVLVPSARSM